jgi:hypothetical protein
MNTSRSFAVLVLIGFLSLSSTQGSFGQAPAGAGGGRRGPQPAPPAGTQPVPADDLPVPPTADDPPPGAPVQPLPPDPAQAIPPVGVPAGPVPAAPVPPVFSPPAPVPGVQPLPGVQAVPGAGFPSLTLIRGSHIIGARAILFSRVVIGTVQDLLSVEGSGEYVLVANPSGFVTIPRSLTIFDPVRRILRVNMTFAEVGELPRLLHLAQLNRQFLGRVHGFFRSPRGEAILRNGVARNARPALAPSVAERRADTRTGGAERRAETRTASKPAVHPQSRTESHSEKGPDARR